MLLTITLKIATISILIRYSAYHFNYAHFYATLHSIILLSEHYVTLHIIIQLCITMQLCIALCYSAVCKALYNSA